MLKLKAKSLKVTLVVDPGEFFGTVVPAGVARVPAEIGVAGRVVRVEFHAKSLRKAIAAVDAGGEVTMLVQGRLEAGDHLADAGIVAMPKTTRKDAAA